MAQNLLDRAHVMLTVRLYEDAGRTAYLAGHHASHAFIFMRTGQIQKTHNGVFKWSGCD
jgi:uncharacterized protein (UPF0332 family)